MKPAYVKGQSVNSVSIVCTVAIMINNFLDVARGHSTEQKEPHNTLLRGRLAQLVYEFSRWVRVVRKYMLRVGSAGENRCWISRYIRDGLDVVNENEVPRKMDRLRLTGQQPCGPRRAKPDKGESRGNGAESGK